MYHYTTCLPVDPLHWMGAVKIRVQTADKNIIIQVYLKEIEYVEKVFFL